MATAKLELSRVHFNPMNRGSLRFKEIIDVEGVPEVINKNDLGVDPIYQRKETDSKVRRLAAEWSWLGCGCILVARRPDGRNFVYDGNHRVMAARLRKDVNNLPCLVFRCSEVVEEAVAFLNANVNRKPVTAYDRFRALLIAEDPAALLVQRLAEENGLTVEGNHDMPTTIRCVWRMLALARSRRDVLIEMFPLIAELCQGSTIHGKLLEAIIYLQWKLRPLGESLLSNPWRERVLRLGRDGAVNALEKASAYYAQGGGKVWARGLVDSLNKGLRNRLVVPGLVDED